MLSYKTEHITHTHTSPSHTTVTQTHYINATKPQLEDTYLPCGRGHLYLLQPFPPLVTPHDVEGQHA